MKRARILWRGKEGKPQSANGVVEGDTIVLENGTTVPVSEVSYLPPIVPRQIIATHLAYRSRCEEYRMQAAPAYPSFFMKPLGSVSHHKANVARPHGCKFLNYEGEIAVVIGKTCSNVPISQALDFVKGYTVANDWGVHDFRHADRGAMFRVKGQDGFCPLGPYLVDADDINPNDLWLRTYVNGRVVQEAHTGTDLIFSIAYQIADVSRLITLEENDVMLTGTPAHSRPVELGDVVAVEVDGIGRLENTVVELDRNLVPVGDQPRVTDQTLHVALALPEDQARKRVAEYHSREAGKE
jgi:5-oxopent-3-ene-1,2,5-tricarboxylate decarboxylase/2-hydroxyhepta-2,4-diene-1,7-dioate isomerase